MDLIPANSLNNFNWVMTFLRADTSRLQLTSDEMLEISRDISVRYLPALESAKNASLFSATCSSLRIDNTSYNADAVLHHSPISGNSLSAKELLEISVHINQQYAHKSAVLAPELLILPVDPYHLYACWDLGEKFQSQHGIAPCDKTIMLRVFWWSEASVLPHQGSNVWLDIPLDLAQQRKQIRLPLPGSVYSAALGRLLPGYHFDVLAYSNQIRVPAIGNKEAPWIVKNTRNLWELLPPNPVQENALKHFPTESWQVKLHTSTVRQNVNGKPMLMLSELMNQLGISVELIPEFDVLKAASSINLRASGQGITDRHG